MMLDELALRYLHNIFKCLTINLFFPTPLVIISDSKSRKLLLDQELQQEHQAVKLYLQLINMNSVIFVT